MLLEGQVVPTNINQELTNDLISSININYLALPEKFRAPGMTRLSNFWQVIRSSKALVVIGRKGC
jgi:hypothetical protein